MPKRKRSAIPPASSTSNAAKLPDRPLQHPDSSFMSADRPQRGHPEVPSGPLETATVARGRCIEVPTGEQTQRGFNPDSGEIIKRGITTRVHHPDTVTLPASEIRRLRHLGYLVDPAKIARNGGDLSHALPMGPKYATKTSPS